MDYELEFHPVGEGVHAGDAISLRYWDGEWYRIIIIDGGTNASGAALVDHINTYYGPDAFIDHVVSTHPDNDHACGLRAVMEAFPVGRLWVHIPWNHAAELQPYFAGRWSINGLATAIRNWGSFDAVSDLLEIAAENNVPISEPFAGNWIGALQVLSPTLWSYLHLVPQFRNMPNADYDALNADGFVLGARPQGGGPNAVVPWVAEHWNHELLREGAVTSAENESCTVLLGNFGAGSFLLTADAGVWALTWACNSAEDQGIDLRNVTRIQVPHHGSRSNVTPSLLDRLVGPPLPLGWVSGHQAIVSCPADDARHPRKMVLNAFRRRGALVYRTQGGSLRLLYGMMPERAGLVPKQPYDWHGTVEGYD